MRLLRSACSVGWLVLLGMGFSVECRLVAGVGEMEAGVARVDLTPPLEMQATLGGYGERMSRPATGVRDRVWAKAVVFGEGGRRLAMVTADVLAFPPGFHAAVVERLRGEGWSADRILLLPSHSHTSIDMTALNPRNTFGMPQIGIYQPAVHEHVLAAITEVIRVAGRTRGRVRLGTRTAVLEGWNRNRRRGDGVDRELTVTRVDGERGAPVAVLVNWTAHPTFLGPEHMEFSGDWPGHLQRTLEALVGGGVTVLYYNGAEGDQSPTPRPDGGSAWEQAERYGRELAIEAWRQWQAIRPRRGAGLAWEVERVSLPSRVAHPDFKRTGGKEYGLTDANIGELLERLFPTETTCTSVRLGDLVIVGVPCEMAAGLGLEVKSALRGRSGVKHVAIGGMANEWVSYALAPEEYRRGGYEASVSFYGETLGPVLAAAAIRSGAGAAGRR